MPEEITVSKIEQIFEAAKEQSRKELHNAVVILVMYANCKNEKEMIKVVKLINQNTTESDYEALHLMFRRKRK